MHLREGRGHPQVPQETDAAGANVTNLSMVVIYKCSKQARVLAPGRPFQPRLMLLSKAGAYSSEVPFRCSTLGEAPQALD